MFLVLSFFDLESAQVLVGLLIVCQVKVKPMSLVMAV